MIQRDNSTIYAPHVYDIYYCGSRIGFKQKEGDQEFETRGISTIFILGFYGESLKKEVLTWAMKQGVTIVIHHTHNDGVLVITPEGKTHKNSVIEQQILIRAKDQKRLPIVRRILMSKFRAHEWITAETASRSKEKYGVFTLSNYLLKEAHAAKKYEQLLKERFELIPVKWSAIEGLRKAGVKLLIGKLNRWILYYGMHQSFGFLHTQTSYCALAYDLVEPYRAWVDMFLDTYLRSLNGDQVSASAFGNGLIEFMKESVYSQELGKETTRSEILKECVHGFKAYLEHRSDRLLIPFEDAKRRSGRKRMFLLNRNK